MNSINTPLFDFDDILIQPAYMSDIRSRKEVNPKYGEYGHYPLMTAPMDTVISKSNDLIFEEAGILPVLPRIPNADKNWWSNFYFYSYSLEQFDDIFLKNDLSIDKDDEVFALIDIANGHMKALFNSAKAAKEKYGKRLKLMVGNVGNPLTFEAYCNIGVDYVRIGIGNGNACLTTVQTGVGYPMASLIKECYRLKKNMNYQTKIVADGGFKKYSDIIKALGLGADYVMLGSILNKALESAGETIIYNGKGRYSDNNDIIINQYDSLAKERFESGSPIWKTFRGMSTKEVQKDWGIDDLKTSEGVIRQNKVEYTLDGWIENFDSYLRSTMSYTGHKELHTFIGGVHINFISENSFKRFNK